MILYCIFNIPLRNIKSVISTCVHVNGEARWTPAWFPFSMRFHCSCLWIDNEVRRTIIL